MSYRERYLDLFEQHGTCPIEAGLMCNLADNECVHGRLPGDSTPPCGCWRRPVAVTRIDALKLATEVGTLNPAQLDELERLERAA